MAALWVHEMITDLERAGNKTGNVFKRYMKYTGRSRSQLYRIAKKNGWTPWREKRKKLQKIMGGGDAR